MSKPNDDELEKRIVKIMAMSNHYDAPAPISKKTEYGYYRQHCPVCDQGCLGLKGYHTHWVLKHRPEANRQKAKKIIKAMRKQFREEGKVELAEQIARKVDLAFKGVHPPDIIVMPWEQIARPILYKLLPRRNV